MIECSFCVGKLSQSVMSIHLAIADVENFTSITISVVQEAISSIVIPAVRPLDYSHTGPAFYTWHRLMNLWFECEIQGMLQGMGQQDYHTFRLPYWDWRTEIQTTFGVRSEELFTESRLGVTRNVSGFPHVFGTLYEGTWETICWLQLGQICDPRIGTGPLQRCPFTGTDPCNSRNPDWPTLQNVDDAMTIDEYDAPPYTIFSRDGFRSFVDFKVGDDLDECRSNRLCQCIPGGPSCVEINGIPPGPTITGQMHFLVSPFL